MFKTIEDIENLLKEIKSILGIKEEKNGWI